MNGKASPRYYPLDEWKFGEVNYYLTQLLSEHGYLCKYLAKMGTMTRSNCIYGDASIYNVEHNFFHCKRGRLERRNLEAKVGIYTIENFCNVTAKENWNSMASYIEALLKSKKFDLRNPEADMNMKEPNDQTDFTTK